MCRGNVGCVEGRVDAVFESHDPAHSLCRRPLILQLLSLLAGRPPAHRARKHDVDDGAWCGRLLHPVECPRNSCIIIAGGFRCQSASLVLVTRITKCGRCVAWTACDCSRHRRAMLSDVVCLWASAVATHPGPSLRMCRAVAPASRSTLPHTARRDTSRIVRAITVIFLGRKNIFQSLDCGCT